MANYTQYYVNSAWSSLGPGDPVKINGQWHDIGDDAFATVSEAAVAAAYPDELVTINVYDSSTSTYVPAVSNQTVYADASWTAASTDLPANAYFGFNAFDSFNDAYTYTVDGGAIVVSGDTALAGTTLTSIDKALAISGSGAIELGTVTVTKAMTINNVNLAATSLTNNVSITASGTATFNISDLAGKPITFANGVIVQNSIIENSSSLAKHFFQGNAQFVGTNILASGIEGNYNSKFTIAAGSSLTAKANRLPLSYGLEFSVTGSISDALTADKTQTLLSLDYQPGFSLVGDSTSKGTFTVTDAYVKLGNTSSSASAKGNYTLTFTNSIVEFTNQYQIQSASSPSTVTTKFDGSVVTIAGNLKNEIANSQIILQNGTELTVNTSFRNDGDVQVLSGSKMTVNGYSGMAEHAGQNNKLTVSGTGSYFTITNTSTGNQLLNSGSVTLSNGGKAVVNYIKNTGTITIDATSLLQVTALTSTEGSIVIKPTGLDAGGDIAKVIDITGTAGFDASTNHVSAADGARILQDKNGDGDVYVTNVDADKLFVNAAWTKKSDQSAYAFGEAIEGETGKFYGVNAFSALADAAAVSIPNASGASTKVTTTITLQGSGVLSSKASFSNGQNVIITGGSEDHPINIKWHNDDPNIKDWLFVGRGISGADRDAITYVTIKDAYINGVNLPAAFASTGFHVSGYNTDSGDTNYGVLTIEDSTITCDYLLNRNVVDIVGSDATFVNMYIHGRNAEESKSGTVETATLNISNYKEGGLNKASNVTLTAINGMPLGAEGKGEINIADTSSFEITANSDWTISAIGTLNLTDQATFTAANTVTNNGAINMTFENTFKANSISGTGAFTINASSYTGGTYKVIDLTQDTSLKGVITVKDLDTTKGNVFYGADGDVVISDADTTTLFVNSAWTGYAYGEAIEGDDTGKYFGINAFNKFTDALAVDEATTITLLSDVTENNLTAPVKVLSHDLQINGTGKITWNVTTLNTFESDSLAVFVKDTEVESAKLTFGDGVNFTVVRAAEIGTATYFGYNKNQAITVDNNGAIELGSFYVSRGTTYNLKSTGTINVNGYDGQFLVRKHARLNITGTGAEYTLAAPQVYAGFVTLQGGITTLTDTVLKVNSYIQIYNRNVSDDAVNQPAETVEFNVTNSTVSAASFSGNVHDTSTEWDYKVALTDSTMTITGSLSNYGTSDENVTRGFVLSNSTLFVGNILTNNGSFTVSGNSLLTIGTLDGTITVDANANLTGSAVGGDGVIAVDSGVTLTIGAEAATSFGAVTNAGTIDVVNGAALTVAAGFTNTGAVTITTGVDTTGMITANTIDNTSGTITINAEALNPEGQTLKVIDITGNSGFVLDPTKVTVKDDAARLFQNDEGDVFVTNISVDNVYISLDWMNVSDGTAVPLPASGVEPYAVKGVDAFGNIDGAIQANLTAGMSIYFLTDSTSEERISHGELNGASLLRKNDPGVADNVRVEIGTDAKTSIVEGDFTVGAGVILAAKKLLHSIDEEKGTGTFTVNGTFEAVDHAYLSDTGVMNIATTGKLTGVDVLVSDGYTLNVIGNGVATQVDVDTLRISNATLNVENAIIDSAVTNDGTVNVTTAATITSIENNGIINVQTAEATITGNVDNVAGTINATSRGLTIVGNLTNGDVQDEQSAQKSVITARELTVTGTVVNYGAIGRQLNPTTDIPVETLVVGTLENYQQVLATSVTATSISNDGSGYIYAGTIETDSLTNKSGEISAGATGGIVGITVTGTLDNGVSENVNELSAIINTGDAGSIKAGTLNNKKADSQIITGSIEAGTVTNDGEISVKAAAGMTVTNSVTNNATGQIFIHAGSKLEAASVSNAGTINVANGAAINADIANTGTINLSGNVTTGAITGSGTVNLNGVSGIGTITGTMAVYASGTSEINNAIATTAGRYDQGYTTEGTSVVTLNANLTAKNYFIGNDSADPWSGETFNATDKLVINSVQLTSPAPQDNTHIYVRGTGEIEANDATIGTQSGNLVGLVDYGKISLTDSTAYFTGFVVYGVDINGTDGDDGFTKAVFNATGSTIDVTGTLNSSEASQYSIVDGFQTSTLVGGKGSKGVGTLNLDSTAMTVHNTTPDAANFAIGFAKDGTVNMTNGSTLTVGGTIGIGLGTGTGALNVSFGVANDDLTGKVTADAITIGSNGSLNLTIDSAVSSLTEDTYKLVDVTGDAALSTDKITVNGTAWAEAGKTFGDYTLTQLGNDIILTTADTSSVAIGEFTGAQIGDTVVVGEQSYIFGINAYTDTSIIASNTSDIVLVGGNGTNYGQLNLSLAASTGVTVTTFGEGTALLSMFNWIGVGQPVLIKNADITSNGTFATRGALTVTSSNITAKYLSVGDYEGASVTVDANSTLSIESMYLSKTVTVDAAAYQYDKIVKVIDANSCNHLENISVINFDTTKGSVLLGNDGDVTLLPYKVSTVTLFVNSAYTGEYGTETSEGSGRFIGINAFSNMFDAIAGRSGDTTTVKIEDSTTIDSLTDVELYLTSGLEFVADVPVVQTINFKKDGIDLVLASKAATSTADKFTVTIGKNVTVKTTAVNGQDTAGVIYSGFYYSPNFVINGTYDANSTIWFGAFNAATTETSPVVTVNSTGRLKGQQFCMHDMVDITVNGAAEDAVIDETTGLLPRLTEAQVAVSYLTTYSGTLTLKNTTMTNGANVSVDNAYLSYINQGRTYDGSFVVLDNSTMTAGTYLKVNGVNSSKPSYLGTAKLTLKNKSYFDGNGTGTDGGNNTVTGSQSSIEVLSGSTLDLAKNLTITDGSVTVNDSTLIVGNILTLTNNGTFTVSGDSLLTIGTLDGTITVDADADLTGSVVGGTGVIAVNEEVELSLGNNTATATSFGAVTNAGEIDIDGSQVNLGALTNSGTIKMDWQDKLTFSGYTHAGGTVAISLEEYTGVTSNTLILENTGATAMDATAYRQMLGVEAARFDKYYTVIDNDLYLKAGVADVVYVTGGMTIAEAVTQAKNTGAMIDVLDGTFSGDSTFDGVETVIDGGSFVKVPGSTVAIRITGGIVFDSGSADTKWRVWGDTEGDETLTVNGGTFNGVVVTGDRLIHGNIEHTGTYTLNITDGTFNSAVAGGMMHDVATNNGDVDQVGDINLNISGGSFTSFIYGGNIARKKGFSGHTSVTGNITITIDVSENAVGINTLIAGSYGIGTVTGTTEVVLTGLAENLSVSTQIWGGCSGDTYTIKDGKKVAESYVMDVNGDPSSRTLTFQGFTGLLNVKSIKMFSDVSIDAASAIDFSKFTGTLGEVDNWEITYGIVDGFGAVKGKGAFQNDFAGDTLTLNGLEALSAEGDSWVIFDNASKFTGTDGIANINGTDFDGSYDRYVFGGGMYALSFSKIDEEAKNTSMIVTRIA